MITVKTVFQIRERTLIPRLKRLCQNSDYCRFLFVLVCVMRVDRLLRPRKERSTKLHEPNTNEAPWHTRVLTQPLKPGENETVFGNRQRNPFWRTTCFLHTEGFRTVDLTIFWQLINSHFDSNDWLPVIKISAGVIKWQSQVGGNLLRYISIQ